MLQLNASVECFSRLSKASVFGQKLWPLFESFSHFFWSKAQTFSFMLQPLVECCSLLLNALTFIDWMLWTFIRCFRQILSLGLRLNDSTMDWLLRSFPVVIRKVFSKMLLKEKASLTIVKKRVLWSDNAEAIYSILANLEKAKDIPLNRWKRFAIWHVFPSELPIILQWKLRIVNREN